MAEKAKSVNTIKVTFIITIVAVCSKILGFARDAILAHYYGSTTTTDIFITTLSLPDILFELIANAITIGFVPIATALLIKGNNDKSLVNQFCSKVISLFELLAIIFVLFFYLFAKPIIGIAAPGFTGNSIDTASTFLKIIAASILFKTISSILGAYMQTNKRFIPVSMYGAIMDVVIILFIFISLNRNEVLLAYGVLTGVLVQMLFATICAYKTGFRFSISFDYKDENIRSMLIMFLPAIAATGANQIIQIVNKAMATTVVEGGVTMISNANKMGFAAENIIVLSIAAVIYPALSEYANCKNDKGFAYKLQKGLNSTFVLMIPLTCALIVYSYPIIDLLFGHGKYVDAVSDTSYLMKIYCLGILGLSSYTIVVRALYAQKMVKQSAMLAIISLIINIVLCIWLAKHTSQGLFGIAEATSLTYTLSFIIAIFILKKKVGNFGFRNIFIVFCKSVIACIPMLGLSYYFYRRLTDYSMVLALLICALMGAAAYYTCMYFLKVDEINAIVQRVLQKIRRK